MKVLSHYHRTETRFEFTRAELETCILASQSHYDGACKAASEQGGFLFGMANLMKWAEEEGKTTAEKNLTSRELDLLCKILECFGRSKPYEDMALYTNARKLLLENHAATERANESADYKSILELVYKQLVENDSSPDKSHPWIPGCVAVNVKSEVARVLKLK